MNDQSKTKQQLLEELTDLRRRVAEQETQIAQHQQAEADQQQINDNLPVLVTTAGFDGYCKKANAALKRILGWSEQELFSRSIFEYFHPDDRAEAVKALERLKSGETLLNFVNRALCKDGSCRWVSWVVIPLPNQKVVFGIGKDITEQKRIEESLRESEERYRQLTDSTPDVIYILDETGKLLYANRVAGAYFGVSPASLVGKTQHDLFPPEKIPSHLEGIREAFETGNMGDAESLYRFGDHEVWLNVRTIPLRDKHGRVTSLMGVCRDITKRKQAEEALKKAHDELEERVKERTAELMAVNKALRESEENFRTLVDMLPDAVLTSDLMGYVTFASRQALQMYGAANVEDMLERNPLDFFAPGDQQRFLANVQITLEEGVTRDIPYDLVRKDGTHFAGEVSAATINDMSGKPKGFVAILRDITQRKQAEEALQQSHDELRTIHDGMSDGFLIADAETMQLVQANASICRMLGYSEEEILSKSVMDMHPTKDIPVVAEIFRSQVEGRLRVTVDFPVMRKDGSTFFADIGSDSIIYKGRLCIIGFFHDVTESKQAQEALEQERQSLWKMLQASDHERQIISYDIHDGLAQYLAAAGMGFQAYDSMKENSPDEAKKAYETAVELVRQAHSESRRLIGEVRHPVIDERGLATAIVSLAYEQQQREGIRIECHTNVEFNRLPPILENALYRMVQEALTNACKHSKSKKVTVTMIQEGQDVRLEVQDWGTGFDTEAIEKGHFGLESIRQRVRLLGGRLTIESKPDSGTLVQVVVPILEKQVND